MSQQHKQISLTSTATDSTWNPIAEEDAAASFTHASYKPKTNILTSDTFSLSLLYACYDNKPFFIVLFKRSFVIHLCCQIISQNTKLSLYVLLRYKFVLFMSPCFECSFCLRRFISFTHLSYHYFIYYICLFCLFPKINKNNIPLSK